MRGKVSFEVAGQEYALRFTTNRICQLEEEAGETVLAVCAKMEDPGAVSFTDLRMIFRAGLVGEFSLDQAGDILDDIGLERGLLLVSQAMGAAFSVAKAGDGKAGKKPAGAV